MPEEDKPTEKEKIYVTLPANAIIREVPAKNFAVFNMPKTGSLSGYRYLVNLSVIGRSEDGETVTFPLKDKTTIKKNGEADTLSANMMKTFLSGTTADDYKDEDIPVFMPVNAVYSRYDKVTRVLMLPTSEYKGLFCVLPNSCLDEGKSSEDGETFVLHDWMRIKVRTKDGTDVALSAKDFASVMEAGMDSYLERIKLLSVTVPREAVIMRYDKQTHMHMSKGEYGGYAYYIPNGMVKGDGEDGLRLVIPETRNFTIRNLKDEKKTLTAEELVNVLTGKTAEDYLRISKEEIDGFTANAAELKEKLPADLLKSDCWVDVRVKKYAAGKSYFSTSISRHKAGRADAEIKGVPFEEVEEYGKVHGADTFGYAFDGKGIVCLSVNDSFDEKGALTEKAQKILLSAKDTYAEKSASGKDIHIFGIVGGVDTEFISKDKSMELYYGADYLAMTGDMSEEKESPETSHVESSSDSDSFISDEIKAGVASVVERFTRPVEVVAVLSDDGARDEISGFVGELSGIHPKLTVKTEEGEGLSHIDIRAGGKSHGVRFDSVPGGHEFNSFVIAMYNVAGPGQPIDGALKTRIERIKGTHTLKVMATLSCTNCPDVVMGTQRIASLNENVTAEMYDLSIFPDIKEKYNIMAVPCLVVDGTHLHFGKQTLEGIVEIVEKYD